MMTATATAPRTRLDAAGLLAGTTPGPWSETVLIRKVIARPTGKGETVAVASTGGLTSEECLRNARLIAAAPDLAARVLELEAACVVLRDLVGEAMTMVGDLCAGYPEKELHTTTDDINQRADSAIGGVL